MRHGETEGNKQKLRQGVTNSLLHADGIQQAIQAAKFFHDSNIEFTTCYTSDLTRTVETASYITSCVPRQLQILREKDFGIREMLPFHITKEEAKILKPHEIDTSESDESVLIRCKTFIDYLQLNHTDNDILLVVSHGGFIKILLQHYFMYEEVIKNCSISKLQLHKDGTLENIFLNYIYL